MTPVAAPPRPARPALDRGTHAGGLSHQHARSVAPESVAEPPALDAAGWWGVPAKTTPEPVTTVPGAADASPFDTSTSEAAALTPGRLVDASAGLGEGYHRSLIYSGVLGLALAATGLAMVAWRRRSW